MTPEKLTRPPTKRSDKMLDPDELDLPTMLKLHKHLGALICEKMGHNWQTVDVAGDHGTVNAIPMDKCRRCGDTRSNITSSSTTNQDYELTFSDGES